MNGNSSIFRKTVWPVLTVSPGRASRSSGAVAARLEQPGTWVTLWTGNMGNSFGLPPPSPSGVPLARRPRRSQSIAPGPGGATDGVGVGAHLTKEEARAANVLDATWTRFYSDWDGRCGETHTLGARRADAQDGLYRDLDSKLLDGLAQSGCSCCGVARAYRSMVGRGPSFVRSGHLGVGDRGGVSRRSRRRRTATRQPPRDTGARHRPGGARSRRAPYGGGRNAHLRKS